MNDLDGITQGQILEVHCREQVDAVFSQVTLGFGVNQFTLNQVVAGFVCIKDIRAHSHFIQPLHWGRFDFIDLLKLGNALCQGFGNLVLWLCSDCATPSCCGQQCGG